MSWASSLASTVRTRGIEWVTGLGRGRNVLLASYRYAFDPAQLWAISETAGQASAMSGAFAEIGVFTGETTLYLHQHLASLGRQVPYYCVDTFSGFTTRDIQTERNRGKVDDYHRWFRSSSRVLFERMVAHNRLPDVHVIQADASTFDYGRLPPLAFALVDVDLLRPMRAALEGCWERLVPGGVMIADDCHPGENMWDGAREAYMEFCADHGLEVDVRRHKLGFVTKLR